MTTSKAKAQRPRKGLLFPALEPLRTHAAAVFPYSKKLAAKTVLRSRFDEDYALSVRVGDELWLPRNACGGVGDDLRADGEAVAFQQLFKPRNAEQGRITAQAAALLKTGEDFIVQAPTGWGKTYCGCAVAGELGRRTLVITTKEDVLDQWRDAAQAVLGLAEEQVGVWRGDQVPKPSQPFVVGLVQSLMKGPERYPGVDYASFGLVICDEVHRMGADHFSQAMWWFPARHRLGLSATPYRKDGKEVVFHSHIGPVQLTAIMETLIPKVIVAYTRWRVPRVRRHSAFGVEIVPLPHEAGKTMHLMRYLARDARRNELIAKFITAALRKRRHVMVFADTLEHLRAVHRTLNDYADLPPECIGYYVGTSDAKGSPYKGGLKARKDEREHAKTKPVLLATYSMASEATDIPWMDTCVLASPRSDVVQIVGRIRREYPDKARPVVLDLVDDDSRVFAAYAKRRLRWYCSLGCEVVFRPRLTN